MVVDGIGRKEFLRMVEAEILEVRMQFKDRICVRSVVDHGTDCLVSEGSQRRLGFAEGAMVAREGTHDTP